MDKRLTRAMAFQLFSIVSVPIHIWIALLWAVNLSPNEWAADPLDRLAELGYALLMGLAESLIVAAILVGLAWTLSRKWKSQSVAAWLGLSALAWALGQFMVRAADVPELAGLGKFALWVQGWAAWALAAALVVLVVWARQRFDLEKGLLALFSRLGLLMGFYLAIDGGLILLILIRNVA